MALFRLVTSRCEMATVQPCHSRSPCGPRLLIGCAEAMVSKQAKRCVVATADEALPRGVEPFGPFDRLGHDCCSCCKPVRRHYYACDACISQYLCAELAELASKERAFPPNFQLATITLLLHLAACRMEKAKAASIRSATARFTPKTAHDQKPRHPDARCQVWLAGVAPLAKPGDLHSP